MTVLIAKRGAINNMQSTVSDVLCLQRKRAALLKCRVDLVDLALVFFSPVLNNVTRTVSSSDFSTLSKKKIPKRLYVRL